ncbi:hypothetical protein QEJ31_01630 [Pigmentibacter sp. JX0631]|uniref:hypothetical protein n=1 Tax=Pigmentibacter sp. JX0631 TaxID=2976982 RepID=UPI002469ADAE|nr:hypothetical protein [Pigmentibacter sp. JX0631]WGL60302.1 hypothetical protein QEJ31_01630 [Pigmentibacter sp. JX0631]
MKNKYLYLSVLMGLSVYSSNSLANEVYLSCDKNDILVSYDKGSNVATYQINNKNLINEVKRFLPNLTQNQIDILKENNSIEFLSNNTIMNGNYSSLNSSYFSQVTELKQKETNRSYLILSSRVKNGLALEVHEYNPSNFSVAMPITTSPLVQWNFKKCEKKNAVNSEYDPFSFGSQKKNQKNNTIASNKPANLTEVSKKLFDRRVGYLKDKNISGILSDYSDDAQLIINGKVITGKSNIEQVFVKIAAASAAIEGYSINKFLISDQIIYLTWNVKVNGIDYNIGSDTFVVINGKIKYQVITADENLFKNM